MGRKEDLEAEKARAIEHWLPSSQKGGRGSKTKATYEKSNLFGKSEKAEGRAAGKLSRKHEKGR